MATEFNIYQFQIRLELSRKADRYVTDTLVRLDIDREMPMASDEDAKGKMVKLVQEELARATGVVEARIDFEDAVKRLISGDTAEGSVIE